METNEAKKEGRSKKHISLRDAAKLPPPPPPPPLPPSPPPPRLGCGTNGGGPVCAAGRGLHSLTVQLKVFAFMV